jgi:SAM-dependent methyltransferase
MFDDVTRPLILDLGCGFGISLIGLASLEQTADQSSFDWSACNFIGVDLSSLSVQYAKSIARRWNLGGRLAFVVGSSDRLLEQVKTYPGSVRRLLIQFPTPFRLPPSVNGSVTEPSYNGGNSQLPKSVSDGFMVTPHLLRQAFQVLRCSSGELLLQSNCEDVAIWMRRVACREAGFVVRDVGCCVDTSITGRPTKRTLDWVAMGGERAIGAGWCSQPILPPIGRTETEIACMLNDTPVHRCLLCPDQPFDLQQKHH